MKTTNFSIRESQIEQLKKHYKETGVRMSEAVRKGIDLYFIREYKKKNIKDNKKKTVLCFEDEQYEME